MKLWNIESNPSDKPDFFLFIYLLWEKVYKSVEEKWRTCRKHYLQHIYKYSRVDLPVKMLIKRTQLEV